MAEKEQLKPGDSIRYTKQVDTGNIKHEEYVTRIGVIVEGPFSSDNEEFYKVKREKDGMIDSVFSQDILNTYAKE